MHVHQAVWFAYVLMLIKLPVAHGLSKVCRKRIKELEAYPEQNHCWRLP